MPQNEQRLTSADVAALLHRTSRTVHRLVEAGKLVPVQKINAGRFGTFLFDAAEVERYLATLTETTAA